MLTSVEKKKDVPEVIDLTEDSDHEENQCHTSSNDNSLLIKSQSEHKTVVLKSEKGISSMPLSAANNNAIKSDQKTIINSTNNDNCNIFMLKIIYKTVLQKDYYKLNINRETSIEVLTKVYINDILQKMNSTDIDQVDPTLYGIEHIILLFYYYTLLEFL